MHESRSGIYAITYKPTGSIYIGQANHVDKRWREHKKQLRAGTHHNAGLQELWSIASEGDFDFRALAAAPFGLSALQLQRWLVREERSYLRLYRERGTVVNAAEPEIVPTGEAIREYEAEEKAREKTHDEQIRNERREIKNWLRHLHELVAPYERHLSQLTYQHRETQERLRKFTGWRWLINSPPAGFDAQAEKQALVALERAIQEVLPQVQQIHNKIKDLDTEYRRLYKQFTKVADKRWGRTCWYAIGSLSTRTRIAE